MSRHLAREDGLFLGASSAVNLVAAVRLALKYGSDSGKTIVTILWCVREVPWYLRYNFTLISVLLATLVLGIFHASGTTITSSEKVSLCCTRLTSSFHLCRGSQVQRVRRTRTTSCLCPCDASVVFHQTCRRVSRHRGYEHLSLGAVTDRVIAIASGSASASAMTVDLAPLWGCCRCTSDAVTHTTVAVLRYTRKVEDWKGCGDQRSRGNVRNEPC